MIYFVKHVVMLAQSVNKLDLKSVSKVCLTPTLNSV